VRGGGGSGFDSIFRCGDLDINAASMTTFYTATKEGQSDHKTNKSRAKAIKFYMLNR
jgi:hypothetical protein